LGPISTLVNPSTSGSDTSRTGNDDATKIGDDDDYIADITVALEAWDPGPTQD